MNVESFIKKLKESEEYRQFTEELSLDEMSTTASVPGYQTPNAFSPNADNVNDVLFVRGENLMEINLKIFDRWGELVFETQDQSVGWDGTFKGEKLDPDVYVYHLTVICVDQTENLIKGNITLMR